MELRPTLHEALQAIKPKSKGLPGHVTKTLTGIQAALSKKEIKAKAILGGSFAKGTYLAKDFDVDIFVQFNQKHYCDKDISKLLKSALTRFKPTTLHGSRDYFQFRKGNIQYEIVPVIEIKKAAEALNVTDCSPLHVAWVSKHIKKLHDEIRLTKQFFKAAGIYGAESYIRGFSGHVIDLLVIMHKGFIPLLKAASQWKPPVVLDFENVHKGKALAHLNPAKTQSPLILIDPVQPNRNASASLSPEKFSLFVKISSQFLKKPSTEAFIIREPNLQEIQKKGPTITITAAPYSGKRDVVGSKLLQVHQSICAKLEPFGLASQGWHWNPPRPALFYYVLETTILPETVTHLGPPTSLKIHAEAFMRKHPTAMVQKNRLIAIEPRTERTPTQVLELILKNEHTTSRVKRLSIQWTIPHP